MRRTLALAACLSVAQAAVVIDRVAVIVGKHVIKLSDTGRDLRLTEFLNRQPLDLSVAARRKSAERLIDQAIIHDELATGGYRRPADSDADTLLAQLRRDRFQDSDARLRQALAAYGLTEDQLREQLLWQLTVLRFIDERFRPGVLVTDEEVKAAAPKTREQLEGERINQDFEAWLDQARKRNRIEYREGAFQ